MLGLERPWNWFEERTGLGEIAKHPVPQETHGRGWMYVFGSATLVSFTVAVITGIPIAATYVPTTGGAYESLRWLDNVAILGKQLRGLHSISATAMLVLVGVHAMRVFLTGSFKFPRELNWLSGVFLLLLTVGLLFTGQILRWDDDGMWTLSILTFISSRTPLIGTGVAHFLLGGPNFGGETVNRIFALHVFVLPGLLMAIVGFHLYMVIKVGISESPRAGRPVDPATYRRWYEDLLRREGVPFWPDAAWRDAVFATLVIVAIIVISFTLGAQPLSGPPDPTRIYVEPRPDWYFSWLFAAYAMAPHGVENYAMIAGPILFVVILLVLPFTANTGERVPTRRPWAVAIGSIAALIVFSLIWVGTNAPWSPKFQYVSPPKPMLAGLSGPALAGANEFASAGCQFCHIAWGTSGGVAGPDLTNIGAQLTPEEMTIRIMNGGTNMPAFAGILTPAQLSDLVAFLQTRRDWTTSAAVRHLQPAPIAPH
jgi:ubiquinol-cytochrome c reductase cytochrome b subunit